VLGVSGLSAPVVVPAAHAVAAASALPQAAADDSTAGITVDINQKVERSLQNQGLQNQGLVYSAVYSANQCTMDGEDCRTSRCCMEVGSQCFQKNWRWASCHPTCYQNRDWDFATHSWVSTGNERRWDCSVLGVSGLSAPVVVPAAHAVAAASALPQAAADDSTAGITVDINQKVERSLQNQGLVYPAVYSANQCTMDGEDCRASRCCREIGSRCFQKNWRWASCHPTCYQNRDWDFASHSWVSTGDERRWDCSILDSAAVAVTTVANSEEHSQHQPVSVDVRQDVDLTKP